MNIIQRCSLVWRRFCPLEERLFAAVRSVLPEAAKPIYDTQVATVHLAQRLLQWNEICYYPKRRGLARQIDWSGVPKFPYTEEFQLAEVRFKVAGERFKATLSCIGGHIFDFHIHPGGKRIAFSTWDAEPRVTLLDDPLRAPTFKKREPIPAAWREFLTKHPDRHPSPWKLYDETSAYRIALEDGEFLVLAAREGDEFVMERLDPPAEHLFHMRGHDGKPEPLREDLTSVITDSG